MALLPGQIEQVAGGYIVVEADGRPRLFTDLEELHRLLQEAADDYADLRDEEEEE